MLQPTTTVPRFKYRSFKFFLQQVHITVVFKSTNAPMRLREDNPQFIQIYRYITYKTIFVCLFWANTMWQLIRTLNSHTWTTPSTYTITRKLWVYIWNKKQNTTKTPNLNVINLLTYKFGHIWGCWTCMSRLLQASLHCLPIAVGWMSKTISVIR